MRVVAYLAEPIMVMDHSLQPSLSLAVHIRRLYYTYIRTRSDTHTHTHTHFLFRISPPPPLLLLCSAENSRPPAKAAKKPFSVNPIVSASRAKSATLLSHGWRSSQALKGHTGAEWHMTVRGCFGLGPIFAFRDFCFVFRLRL